MYVAMEEVRAGREATHIKRVGFGTGKGDIVRQRRTTRLCCRFVLVDRDVVGGGVLVVEAELEGAARSAHILGLKSNSDRSYWRNHLDSSLRASRAASAGRRRAGRG